MPIIVQSPTADGPFGPGFAWEVTSSFVGPLLSPSWTVSILSADLETNVYSMGMTAGSFMYNASGWMKAHFDVPIPQNLLAHGSDAVLRFTLGGSAGVVETLDMPIKLDEVQGRMYNLSVQMQQMANQVTGLQTTTFNNTDRAELANVKAQTLVSWPGLPVMGVGTAIQLAGGLLHPPLGFVARELIGDFDGNGSLTRTAPGVGVNAFGLTWEILTYGQGIGVDAGLPVRLETRMLELVLDHTDRHAHEFVSATALFDYSNAYWFFPEAFPTRVNFQIAPSVTLRLYWLLVSLT